MFTEVLDEQFISYFDQNNNDCKVMIKSIQMDSLTQINMGLLCKDNGDNIQIVD